MPKIKFDRRNYRKHNDENKRLIRRSLEECGAGRSVVIDADDELIAGNGVYEQAQAIGLKTRIVETDGTELVVVKRKDLHYTDEKRKQLAVMDNSSSDSSEWDVPALEADFTPIQLDLMGIQLQEPGTMNLPNLNPDEAEIERKRKEFEERMKAGEIDEGDEEYQEFLEKFAPKKTTDDCYTPALVYDAVADWVASEYGLNKANFVRPFYPGGDYQKENYLTDCVVVDNPPFSIMAEILKFYTSKGVRFFLFGPHLTLFSSSSSLCTALPVGVPITYENGAVVSTSFLTNLEDKSVRFKSEPTLYANVKAANEENQRQTHRELPKYAYDHHIITTPFLSALSRLGIPFEVSVQESEPISQLDSQKASGKAIFGKGYIVSDRVFAEREKAEREKSEREKAERWTLSERELAIVARLSK